jgi:ubiquinone/menaquinone biosynthesis C-methylase UbiE
MTNPTTDWHAHYEASAPAWERWADALAAQQEKVNAALLDEADIGAGHAVLDLASGVGEPALQAARRVGPTGRVVATDVSARMLEALQGRARAAGLPKLEVRVTAMERLPFDDGSFDAVTCRYGLMYATDIDAVARECLRVLRPGGRLATLVWGPEAANTTLYVACRALQRLFPGRITEAEMVAPLRYAEPGVLAGVFEAAGASLVRDREIAMSPRIRKGTPFWRPLVEMNMGELWTTLDAQQRAQAASAIETALEAHAEGEHYVLRTSMRLIGAQRPD